jgi:hypothetical protein
LNAFVRFCAAVIYVIASLAFVAGMYLLSLFSKHMYAMFGVWFLPPTLLFFLWIGVKLENSEQRRTGVKKPIWRWNND